MGIFGIAKRGFGMLGKKSKGSKISPTIKSVKPTVGKAGQFVRQKIELIKKAGKTQKKMGIDKFKELGADKTAKEILRMKVPKVREPKMFGGLMQKVKDKRLKDKEKKKSIKEKILPKKKKDRLEELRKELD